MLHMHAYAVYLDETTDEARGKFEIVIQVPKGNCGKA